MSTPVFARAVRRATVPTSRRAVLAVVSLLAVSAPLAAFDRHPFAPPDAQPDYGPAHEYDLQHVRLDLRLDWAGRSVAGTATDTLVPLLPATRHLTFHAAGLAIESVRLAGEGRDLGFSLDPAAQTLGVDLDRDYGPADRLAVEIRYSAHPPTGLYFVGPDKDYPGKPRQIWSQGETTFNRYWFPSWDWPDDKATSELLATVEPGWSVVGNGRLVETLDRPDGSRTFHWSMEQPHSTYLISLVAGELVKVSDHWHDVPVDAWVPPGREEEARRSFGKTADMVDYFSTVTGYPYPYPKYAQTTAVDFIWGGMENVSATTQTLATLHGEAEEPQASSDGLVAHELAHQWFGDLLTCRSWAHAWLNEGFATYFDALYQGHAKGQDELDWELDGDRRSYLAEDRDDYRRPIVTRRYWTPFELFDRHLYDKGALVLHMARYLLGEEAFWKGIHAYVAGHAFQTVTTQDFERALEDASGVPLGALFDSYVYGAGHPRLAAAWDWDGQRHLVHLHLRQTQETDAETGLFSLPIEVELVGEQGRSLQRLPLAARREQDLYLTAAERPRTVVLDPAGWVLAEVDFDKPAGEWVAQLETAEHLPARLAAIRALGRLGGGEAVTALAGTLGAADAFHGARTEAAKALGEVGSAAALSALRPAAADADSRVRAAVFEAMGELASAGEVEPALERALKGDASPFARAAAAKGLGKLDEDPKALAALLAALSQDSYRQMVRASALRSLGGFRAPEALAAARRMARRGSPEDSRPDALQAIAAWAKRDGGETVREKVRRELTGFLDDPQFRARTTAAEALGTLGDPAAIAALERMEATALDHRQRRTARDAIRKLRQKAGEDAGQEKRIEQLERRDEKLERRLDELEHRLPPSAADGTQGAPGAKSAPPAP